MLEQVYGDETVTFKTSYTWFKKFIDGCENFEAMHRNGRPTTADSARRHNSTLVKWFMPQHGVIELLHPYYPDLSLPDFFLFPKLKVALKGRIFTEHNAH
ncbi:hypothetical protein AVEN_230159-1 [Araneus ventricosus]|uniref:Mos1 transposase HTH domain-containing protein n=1 Tax=Araneus ventricosus TaxID=182803 RepID=A0A4Y2RUW0_ARAVE|nr:hypothetical protein AVEN_230159-1 [Araneus ventricosus]